MSPARTADAPACVEFARDAGIDPVGTAGHHPQILAVEIPGPWPPDVAEHPDLVAVAPALQAAGARLQGLLPRPGGPTGRRRVLHLRAPAGPFRAYHRAELAVAPGDLAGTLAELVTLDDPATRATPAATGTPGGSGRPAAPGDGASLAGVAPATPAAVPPGAPAGGDPAIAGTPTASGSPSTGAAVTDVLVCGHGRRDACCGSLGTRLAQRAGSPDGPLDAGGTTRVWRTTHTGGHRFAPTALVLPEGTCWAFLDEARLAGIVDRTLDVADAARLYRGCTGLGDPAVQAADREALLRFGWSWLDHARRGEVLGRDGDRARVRLDHVAPDGRAGAFAAEVDVARRLPVPDCRRPLADARKEAPELRVASFAPI